MLMPSGSDTATTTWRKLTVSLPWLNRRKHDSEIKEAEAAASVVRSRTRGAGQCGIS